MKNFTITLLLFLSFNLFSQKNPIKVTEFVLENGLTVMLTENHNTPQIFGMVGIKSGAKNDPKDATGIAHYLEHMLFKGTETMGTLDFEKEKPFLDEITRLYDELGKTTDEAKRLSIQKQINDEAKKAGEFAVPNDMDQLLTKMGGTKVNAFTSNDMTVYLNAFPANQLEKWLTLYSHRFEKPVFRLFQSELETVYEEKNRAMDSPFRKIFEILLENVYKNHPYGQQTVLGSVEHLKNPSLKKMYEFYNTYYVANNMVLALTGDFDTETVLPMIKEKFGQWKSGIIPDFPIYKEADFDGREFIKKRMTPINAGIMSFRSPPNGHSDEVKFDLVLQILSNSEGTGFLDKLSDKAKVMQAGAVPMPFNDYGATNIFFIPKILRQRLKSAEELVLNEIEQLKKGTFSDEFFEAIKLNKRKEIALTWEHNRNRSLEMVQSYMEGKKWNDYYSKYASLDDISKQDVIDVANKYFGDNYFCFYSKMGFPKKHKLDKPNFDPIIPKTKGESEFATSLNEVPTTKSIPTFVDFKKDISTTVLVDNFEINQVKNPFNNIFDLEIKYGVGKMKIPMLYLTENYLSLLGTTDLSVIELKEAFHKLGASFYFTSTEESFSMHVRGVEDNLEKILQLAHQFLTKVKVDESKLKKLRGDIKADKKLERRDPGYISKSLLEYVLYGNNAPLKREFTKKELKKVTGIEMVVAFKAAQTYHTTINYVGNVYRKKLDGLCRNYLLTNTILAPKEEMVILDRKAPKQTTFYILHDKKQIQSQIYFQIEGSERKNSDVPKIDAFNTYFGGGMSSLVFQEIREFRSLAYSAWGRYRLAKKEGKNNHFIGYIGCQGDKTNDAIDAMLVLLNDMPEKPERMDLITSSLIEKANSAKPDFRNLAKQVSTWKVEGYQTDPNKVYIDEYKKLNFGDILDVYSSEIKDKPLNITIVGNMKRVDLEKLKKYGKVVEMEKGELFVD